MGRMPLVLLERVRTVPRAVVRVAPETQSSAVAVAAVVGQRSRRTPTVLLVVTGALQVAARAEEARGPRADLIMVALAEREDAVRFASIHGRS